jgi:hypothetical protein
MFQFFGELDGFAVVVEVLTAVVVDLLTFGGGGSFIVMGFCLGLKSLARCPTGLFLVSVDTLGGSDCLMFLSVFLAFSSLSFCSLSSAWRSDVATNMHATIFAVVAIKFVFIILRLLRLVFVGTRSHPQRGA